MLSPDDIAAFNCTFSKLIFAILRDIVRTIVFNQQKTVSDRTFFECFFLKVLVIQYKLLILRLKNYCKISI